MVVIVYLVTKGVSFLNVSYADKIGFGGGGSFVLDMMVDGCVRVGKGSEREEERQILCHGDMVMNLQSSLAPKKHPEVELSDDHVTRHAP